jgi:hypothetical protein
MDVALRAIFNAHYNDELYRRVCALMEERLEEPSYGFRIAETPLLLPADLRAKLEKGAKQILAQLCGDELLAAGRRAIPKRFFAPGDDALPQCVAIDFAIVRDADGALAPRLIELQGFPSLYAMQLIQAEIWSEVLSGIPGMPQQFTPLFSGNDRAAYLELLRRTVVAGADVDQVILLDLTPEEQKTRPDFHATHRLLGVRSVDATSLRRDGRRLFAPKDGRMIPVARLYNRIVFDELEKRGVALPFDWRDELDVTWVCHPNWYWIWSKDSLPRIHHPYAPKTWYLSEFDGVPEPCSNYILKPLFSFAGTGVNPDLTPEAIAAIPNEERSQWILQERVAYAPALIAPDGTGVKAEIRMMFLKPDDADDYTLAINMVRLSRGKIHGVDHNKGLEWVGSAVGVWPAV